MAAEGPIAAVQDSLKRQQFYAGEATGIMDDATRGALRRFQIRHGLPCTGEIDAATLQTLVGNPAAVQPASEAQVAASKAAPQPAAAVVEKDRQFLQKIETGIEPVAPAVQVAPPSQPPAPAPSVTTREAAPPAQVAPNFQLAPPPAPAPPAPAPARSSTTREPAASVAVSRSVGAPKPARSANPPGIVPASSFPAATESRPPAPERRELSVATKPVAPAVVSKPTFIEMNAKSDAPTPEASRQAVAASQPGEVATRKIERPPGRNVSELRELKPAPIASAPLRRTEQLTSAPASPVGETSPPEAVPSRGTKVIRTTTTTTGPDGRTYIHEKKTTISTGKPAPEIEIRRAEPVQPRRKAPGFFEKLFSEEID
jgi:hypothetical protein